MCLRGKEWIKYFMSFFNFICISKKKILKKVYLIRDIFWLNMMPEQGKSGKSQQFKVWTDG